MASLNVVLFSALLALLVVTCYGFRLQKDLESEYEGNSKEYEDSQKAIPVRPGKREFNRMLEDSPKAIPVRLSKRGYPLHRMSEDSQKAIPVRPGKREFNRMLEDPQYISIPVRPGKRGSGSNDASPQWPDVYSPIRPGRK